MTTQMTRHMPLGFSQEQVQRSHAPCPSRHLKQTNPPTTLPTLSPRTAMQTPSRPLVQDRCIQRAMLHLPCTSPQPPDLVLRRRSTSRLPARPSSSPLPCAPSLSRTPRSPAWRVSWRRSSTPSLARRSGYRCSCRWPLPPARRPQHRHLSGGSTFARPAPSSWWKYPTGRIRSSP